MEVRLIVNIHKHKHRIRNTTACLAFVTNLQVKRDDSLARYGETKWDRKLRQWSSVSFVLTDQVKPRRVSVRIQDALITISVVLALRQTSYRHGEISTEILETTVSLYVLFTAARSGSDCATSSAFYKLWQTKITHFIKMTFYVSALWRFVRLLYLWTCNDVPQAEWLTERQVQYVISLYLKNFHFYLATFFWLYICTYVK
jgi:hypothetical protein